MSNELTRYEESGAVAGGPATESAPAGGGGVIASRAAPAGRRQEIEHVMKTDFDRYLAEGLDREYSAILTGEAYAANPDSVKPTVPMDWRDSRDELSATPEGARLVQEWEMRGGFKPCLEIVQATASEIVRDIGGPREQRIFMEHFDRALPEATRFAVYAELMEGAPGYVQPADAAALAKFGATDVGRELLAEWGSDGPRRVATAWKRAERVKEALGDDADVFFGWFDTLRPPEAKAIMRAATR